MPNDFISINPCILKDYRFLHKLASTLYKALVILDTFVDNTKLTKGKYIINENTTYNSLITSFY